MGRHSVQVGTRGQNLRDGLAVALFLLLVGQAVVAAWWPTEPDRAFGLWAGLGAALLFGGIGLLIAATLDLGASWRIGIEEGAAPGLITDGLYRFSRNPIFLALLVIVAGYTMLLPRRLSVILLIGTYLGIRQQVAAEEAYLRRAYGERYLAYARRVGRFLPGLGRLR